MRAAVCTILTGATGRLGSLLGEELLRRHESGDVLLASYHDNPRRPSWSRNARWQSLELRQPDPFVDWAVKNGAAHNRMRLIHLACTMANDLGRAWAPDVEGTLRLCTLLARQRPDILMVIASSTSASNPDSEYGFAKLALEEGALELSRQGAQIFCVRIPAIWPGIEAQRFASTFMHSVWPNIASDREGRDDRHFVDQPQYDVLTA